MQEHKKQFTESVNAFLEEAIVRRELADNFCFYCEHYDSLKGASNWAQKTLDDHRYSNSSLVGLLHAIGSSVFRRLLGLGIQGLITR